jgi:diguanylate cyclase (GGDEF)-like protein
MNSPGSDLELVVAASTRHDVLQYLRLAGQQDAAPWHILEFELHRAGSSIGQGQIVDCLQRLLNDQRSVGCIELMSRMYARNVPFTIAARELAHLRDRLIRLAAGDRNMETVRAIMTLFDALEDALAGVYLGGFLGSLRHRNSVRLRHISTLAEKNLLVHFEKHLDWLGQLTTAVAGRDPAAMPEPHHERCEFGKWLHGEGARLVRDRSHYAHLVETHAAMHHVVNEIGAMLGRTGDSLPLYALMKKAENYSLDLGNEIAMLNSMVIMIHYNKDPMTGALTRRSLERVMINQLEISRATETPFCVLMCDVDHFKQINDSHGHTAGDSAIMHFAAALRSNLRQSDLMFRFGGDEFLLMLPSTTYRQGWEVAEKLRGVVSRDALAVDAGPLTLRASFGLLEVCGSKTSFIDGELVNNLIQECDQRLYLAKRRGRNQVA